MVKEPLDSVTWSLTSLDDDPEYERLDRLVEVVEQGLTACVPPQGTLFALDWQHASFRFSPHLVRGSSGWACPGIRSFRILEEPLGDIGPVTRTGGSAECGRSGSRRT
ncbi:DUF2716 domain-containing protein [Streptomyces sp. NPDC054945]